MKQCVIAFIAFCVTFFFENAKIWVGRTTLNREKKGDGVFFRVTHDGLRERGTTRSLYLVRLDSAAICTNDVNGRCRDDIFQIQLPLADGNFELFSFSAYFSSSCLFQFYVLLLRMVFECLARFKVVFNTLSTAVLTKEKCFAEVAG